MAVDACVVVGTSRDPGELAARHQHDLASEGFDELALLFVRGLDVAQVARRPRRQLIGLHAADDAAADRLGLRDRKPDQLPGRLPIESHPALRRVHRFGDSKAVAPDVSPKRQGAIPVHGGGPDGVGVSQRIGHHMDRGVREAGAWRGSGFRVEKSAGRRVLIHIAARAGQAHALRHREGHHTIVSS